MKASKHCPKCESLSIGVIDVPDGAGVCVEIRLQPVGMKERTDEACYAPAGGLEAWVCTECGYYETYVKDPSTVQFDQLVGFRWVYPKPHEDGPYR